MDLDPRDPRSGSGLSVPAGIDPDWNVNAWRVSNNGSPISEGQIDSSRINIVDLSISKRFHLMCRTRLDLMGQVFNLFNTENLQAQYGGGRVGNALSASFGRILSARPGTQGELAVTLLW